MAVHAPEIARCISTREGSSQDWETTTMVAHSLRGEGFDAGEDGMGRGTPLVPVAFAQNSRDEVRLMGGDGGIVGALAAEPGMKQTCYVAFHPTQDPISSTDGATHAMGCGSSGGQASVAVATYAIQAGALRTNPASGPDGVGVQADRAYTLEARAEVQAVAVALRGREGGATAEVGDDCAFTLRASTGGGDKPHAMTGMAVRRLTPRECERLQGFPDDYTAIPWKRKPASECPDGPRYRALGNSWAVPVARWIGKRIEQQMKGNK